MKTAAKAKLEPRKPSSDERLIALCLEGDQQAWADLVDKYKNLIYSIPIKLGMYDDASDIFQSVCLDLLSDLHKLREPKALPKWLMQVCYHKCLEHRTRGRRQVQLEDEDAENLPADHSTAALPEEMLAQTPARPYQEVAKELGIATGSIGFIRGRCLDRLKKQLEKLGFQ